MRPLFLSLLPVARSAANQETGRRLLRRPVPGGTRRLDAGAVTTGRP